MLPSRVHYSSLRRPRQTARDALADTVRRRTPEGSRPHPEKCMPMPILDVVIRILLAAVLGGADRDRARDPGAHGRFSHSHPGLGGRSRLHLGLVVRYRRHRIRPQPHLRPDRERHRVPGRRSHHPLRRLGERPHHRRQPVGGGRGGSHRGPGLLLGGAHHHGRGDRQPLRAASDRGSPPLPACGQAGGGAGALPVRRLHAARPSWSRPWSRPT